ncbi:Hypothetical predicted protein [Marmota monax]|uniref:Uncharacterized protein n=1 Tax=Marmota monax TaxID=9995 RepID=A0A5E4BSJ7_MARMO|nr:hypothetical protein GHT09_018490 [Marmota monax]VTJ72587.1 Hypothetical predicted protein [Marmota monax]
MALSHPGAPRRETQYFFDVPELMRGHNVVVSFTVRPQSLKAEDENFPIRFQVFKVDSQVLITTILTGQASW